MEEENKTTAEQTEKAETKKHHIPIDFSSFRVIPAILRDPFHLHGMKELPAVCVLILSLLFHWIGTSLLGFGTAFLVTLFEAAGLFALRYLSQRDDFHPLTAFTEAVEQLTFPTLLTMVSSIIMHAAFSHISNGIYSSSFPVIIAGILFASLSIMIRILIAIKINDSLSGWTIAVILIAEALLISVAVLAGVGSAAMTLLNNPAIVVSGIR